MTYSSKMDYGFVSSPSGSPSMSNYSASSQYLDSTSESSSPSSPHIVRSLHISSFHILEAKRSLIPLKDMNNMVFNNPLSFEMYSYSSSPSAFYTVQQGRIPVEYTGSSTLDERDRRRRRTGSTSSSKDKEVLPNMHLVRLLENGRV